jgi:hypothetical protein
MVDAPVPLVAPVEVEPPFPEPPVPDAGVLLSLPPHADQRARGTSKVERIEIRAVSIMPPRLSKAASGKLDDFHSGNEGIWFSLAGCQCG